MRYKNPTIKVSDALFFLAMTTVLAFPGPSKMKALSIIVFFGYMMVIKTLNHRTIRNNLQIFGMFLFLGYAYISQIWAKYPDGVFEQINNVLWTVLLSTAISTYVIYRDLGIRDIAHRLASIALLLFLNMLFNGTFVNNRLTVGINANAFGRLSGGMACIFFACSKRDCWKNMFMNALSAILIVFVLLSGSRTSVLMVGIFVLGVLMLERAPKDIVRWMPKILAIAALCIVGYLCVTRIAFLYRTIGQRIETVVLTIMGQAEGDGSWISRMRMMELAQEFFRENPLLGIGLNNFKFATYYNTYAHNNYVELAACLGIVGLIIYYTPLVIYTKRAYSLWVKDAPNMIIPLIFLIAHLAGDLGGVSYFNVIPHTFIGIAIGLLEKRVVTGLLDQDGNCTNLP